MSSSIGHQRLTYCREMPPKPTRSYNGFLKRHLRIWFEKWWIVIWNGIPSPRRTELRRRSAPYLLLHPVGLRTTKILNSPLTKGDPYSYLALDWLTTLIKAFVDLTTRAIFWITRGSWILGPSLLVWAEKPNSDVSG